MTRKLWLLAASIGRQSREDSQKSRRSLSTLWPALVVAALSLTIYCVAASFTASSGAAGSTGRSELLLNSRSQADCDAPKENKRIIAAPVNHSGSLASRHKLPAGVGGPALPLNRLKVAELEKRGADLFHELMASEDTAANPAGFPSIWPVVGTLRDGFGGRRNPFSRRRRFEFHPGQDISAPRGTPVEAAADGTVIFAGRKRGYGNIVIIEHGRYMATRYGHLSQIDVVPGQVIKQREQIGEVGSTGRSTGPHLHYEVRVMEQPINPRLFLPGRSD